MKFASLIKAVVIAAAGASVVTGALAQSYPNRPIKLVVPFVPGGAVDLYARSVQAALGEDLGQPVIIDNRAGASGIIGVEAVTKAPADGYTLLVGNVGTLAINPAVFTKLPYDPTRDLTPIAKTVIVNFVLAVNPALPVKSVAELIAYGKANPGKLSYGSSGAGGSEHLAAEQFKARTGIQLTHVPYKGTGAALNDLIAGHIQLIFTVQGSIMPHVKAGKLRALAVGGLQRSPEYPDMPTIAEAGNIPGYEAISWQGIAGPAGLPAPIVKRLNDAINKVQSRADVREQLKGAGLTTVGGTAPEFDSYIKSEVGKWTKLAKDNAIKVD